MTINYDHEKLEEILGGKIDPLPDDKMMRITARVLTAAALTANPLSGNEYTPMQRFAEALYWIKKVQSESAAQGMRRGMEQRNAELKRILGIT